ncbi:hypothetical protein SYNTR_0206 [Candidatus Syntrophocurvum alkaliphilum]|uniref:DUF5658 domain-containing protein n=1 Tax=Candidatus Syntrophocurvum alkaliphilum TaxID=2293317 RepID=A0A6I6DGM4_9FIRM|nr:hypothetical protein [Candidatus Syntrophocurvum alkaliphilum]QGT98799.1 hypothetical protein SYNTR_0206 [Candidatus Syntrophocurvum alkaliphilum]
MESEINSNNKIALKVLTLLIVIISLSNMLGLIGQIKFMYNWPSGHIQGYYFNYGFTSVLYKLILLSASIYFFNNKQYMIMSIVLAGLISLIISSIIGYNFYNSLQNW